MKSFPMFIRTTGRRVVIVGGGEQAAQKARLLLKTDAELVLVAPALDAELADLKQRAGTADLRAIAGGVRGRGHGLCRHRVSRAGCSGACAR